jgi:hypothetical protein
MKTILAAAVAIGFFASTLPGAEPPNASLPRYLVLPPAGPSGQLTPSQAPRYAYGWFGAWPRETWRRHFGYYRDYTQWNAK